MYDIEDIITEYGEDLIEYIIENLKAYIDIGECRKEANCNILTNKLGKNYYELIISIIFRLMGEDNQLTDEDKETFENFVISNVKKFLNINPLGSNLNIKIEPINWFRRGGRLSEVDPYWFENNRIMLIDDWKGANGVGLYARLKVEEVDA